MDKYEYNLKLEEIDKLVDQGDYEEAAKLADTIDWRKVRNVRTLCLISEIYEAAGRLDRSKEMLERAYNRSSVGRTVLYRLVEVTTALGQYDEALEYYSEYVQAAPHDNNRYVLKYMIYKGRGSAPQDLIPILEEYLRQEYTERWAYELATVYQQAGQIQKCLATCDDLVLWFHSGKYVKKALELKKRYAVLTPKQQQIYEVCLQEEAQSDYFDDSDEETTLAQPSGEADDEVIAENIIAQTEKEIAGEISARKAEKEKNEQPAEAAAGRSGAAGTATGRAGSTGTAVPGGFSSGTAPDRDAQRSGHAASAVAPVPDIEDESLYEPDIPDSTDDEELQVELARSVRRVISGVARKPEMDEDDVPAAVEEHLRPVQEASRRKEPEPTAGRLSIDDILLSMGEKGRQAAAAARAQREEEAQAAAAGEAETQPIGGGETRPAEDTVIQPMEAATSEARLAEAESAVTQPTSPAVTEVQPTDSVVSRATAPVTAEARPSETAASQPTQPATKVRSAKDAASQPTSPAVIETQLPDCAVYQPTASAAEETPVAGDPAPRQPVKASTARTIAAAAAEELTEGQREALQYSSNPEKLMRNRGALPAYAQDQALGATRRIVNPKEDLLEAARQEMMASRTIRIPAEEISRAYAHGGILPGSEDGTDTVRQEAVPAVEEAPAARQEAALTAEEAPAARQEAALTAEEAPAARQEAALTAEEASAARQEAALAAEETPAAQSRLTASKDPAYGQKIAASAGRSAQWPVSDAAVQARGTASDEASLKGTAGPAGSSGAFPEGTAGTEGTSGELSERVDSDGPEEEYEEYYDDPLTLEPHLRGLFKGFTEIDGLEDQIANAILQALAKGTDRTSRTGNLLIFGAHGSGKTTLAVAIARAIAQEKGQKSAKMAKIYAADLNRRDIAATIAKIAGGILIVEEAGDLNDNTVEQMTTAMEFRTDGLIVILEDEQRYVHDLLMEHPRFTMKFTAQIYLPVYTADELKMFAGCHAKELDYAISEDGYEAIAQKIAAAASAETPMSIIDIVELVDKAIRHSNKFMRKMTMGKKRYNENDYVVLFAKDFK
ncbi:MAG: hypothetical protein LUG93_14090 [Lachnospiraceae bacterium]|nr:hypothetical protein [Lachnospiraceae bacterium]